MRMRRIHAHGMHVRCMHVQGMRVHGTDTGIPSTCQAIVRSRCTGNLRITSPARVGSEQNPSGSVGSSSRRSAAQVRIHPQLAQPRAAWDATLPVLGKIIALLLTSTVLFRKK